MMGNPEVLLLEEFFIHRREGPSVGPWVPRPGSQPHCSGGTFPWEEQRVFTSWARYQSAALSWTPKVGPGEVLLGQLASSHASGLRCQLCNKESGCPDEPVISRGGWSRPGKIQRPQCWLWGWCPRAELREAMGGGCLQGAPSPPPLLGCSGSGILSPREQQLLWMS